MNDITKQQNVGALMEKVILGNDLSNLSPLEKVQHVTNICTSLGLNPLTKPIQLLKFQGKEIPYVTRDGTDQLRSTRNISIPRIETKMVEGGVYVVTAYAQTPDNRQDSSTGVITVLGLKGDALCNAMMKCETKAKRRVTLSICGLGLLSEDELDTMKGHVKVDHNVQTGELMEPIKQDNQINTDLSSYSDYMNLIVCSKTMDILKEIYLKAVKKFKSNPHFIENLTKAKDEAKERIEIELDLIRSPVEDENKSSENVNNFVVNE